MIPKSWDKITIEQFVELQGTLKEEPKTDRENFDLQVKRVCFLTNLEVEEALKLPTSISTDVNKLLKTPMPTQLLKTFKLNGVRYKVILDARKLNGSRYIAVMNTAKRGAVKNLHQVMYNICQPIRFGFRSKFPFIGWKEYDFEAHEVEDRINDFKQLTLDIANPVSVFFSAVSKSLTIALEDYSLQELKKMTKLTQDLATDLKEDMDG